jgi:hypothetical protein
MTAVTASTQDRVQAVLIHVAQYGSSEAQLGQRPRARRRKAMPFIGDRPTGALNAASGYGIIGLRITVTNWRAWSMYPLRGNVTNAMERPSRLIAGENPPA